MLTQTLQLQFYFLFIMKSLIQLTKYNIKNINKEIKQNSNNMKQSSFRQPWTQNEDIILTSLVKKHGAGNWVLISQKMQTKANTFTRSGKQCRQRWHNHLDPNIQKNQWTVQQQKIMFQAHKKFGNKWAQIASQLNGRTDNDIKNHFYSTLRKSLRRLSKMLGQKNSTQKIKRIRPSTLSKLFDCPNDKKAKQTSQALFKFILQRQNMNIKSLCKKDKQLLEALIQLITQQKQQNEQKQQQRKPQTQFYSRLRSTSKKISLQDDSIINLKKISSKKKLSKQQNKIQNTIQQQKNFPKLRQRRCKLSQKQNKCAVQKQQMQQIQVQVPFKKISSMKKSSLFEGLPFNCINDQTFQKNLFSYLDNDKLLKLNSIKKQSQGQEFKLFGELIIPQNISSKKSSSSGFSEMRKIMSNNDRNSIYFSPRQPTPGFGQGLFKTWHIPANKFTKQSIQEQTQNIKKQIQRNIKSAIN